ncbi:Inter-alpha-trypsin inhibitor heavy chain H4-like 2, partial [Homarus americanus]
ELLVRRLGAYAHKINVHPGYPVRDLLVDITIHETRDISLLKVKKVPGGVEFRDAVSEWREGGKTARLHFDPDPEMIPVNGVIHGQLVVHYDVERALDAGDVQVEDGYFVHFFAPIDLQYTPKHITFLIDVSGSMEGLKLEQVKEAMRHILTDLNQGDSFNIIRFSSSSHKFGTMRYTAMAIRKAKKYINNLEADGGTNIDGGLKVALENEMDLLVSESVRPHIIVFLTDGLPSVGVTSESAILRNNRGSARKIYEDQDAAEQLKGFYQELSTPILLDVQFSYSGDAVQMDTLSRTHFYNYFRGTELVVTGQTEPDQQGSIRANITGQGRNGEFFMGVTDWNTVVPPDHHLLDHLHLAPTPKNFIKRLWAFLRIKEEKAARGVHEKAAAQKKALFIALENHFVTPLTSLVVVQPDQENCKDYEDDEKEEDDNISEDWPDTIDILEDSNSSIAGPLDPQDSVVHVFDPKSIQVHNGFEATEYDYDGIIPYLKAGRNTHGLLSSSVVNEPSITLYLTAFCVFLQVIFNQLLCAKVLSDKMALEVKLFGNKL